VAGGSRERRFAASGVSIRTSVLDRLASHTLTLMTTGAVIYNVAVQSFDPGFVDAAVAALERRNTMTVTVTDGQLYLDLNGEALSSGVRVHRLG